MVDHTRISISKYLSTQNGPTQNGSTPRLLTITLAAALALPGCMVDDSTDNTHARTSGSTEESSTDSAAYTRTLSAVVNNLALPTYAQLDDQAAQSTQSIQAYCESMDTAHESEHRAQAQQAWRTLNSTWQKSLAISFGPASANANTLRNRIYSWPDAVNHCTTDQYVIFHAEDPTETASVNALPKQAKGLDSLEYLLFSDTLQHRCSVQIEATQHWNALDEVTRKTQRCHYAAHIAAGLQENTAQLLSEWRDGETPFGETFIAHADQTQALNTLSDQLFLLDDEIKDQKLGYPLALTPECTLNCSDLTESPISASALSNIHQNLIGFKALFVGTFDQPATQSADQLGFDYILATKNFPDLADSILSDLESALSVADRLEQEQSRDGSMRDLAQILEDPAEHARCINVANNPRDFAPNPEGTENHLQLCQLHGYIKQVTDQLKGDFLTIVSLALPKRVEGDND